MAGPEFDQPEHRLNQRQTRAKFGFARDDFGRGWPISGRFRSTPGRYFAEVGAILADARPRSVDSKETWINNSRLQWSESVEYVAILTDFGEQMPMLVEVPSNLPTLASWANG